MLDALDIEFRGVSWSVRYDDAGVAVGFEGIPLAGGGSIQVEGPSEMSREPYSATFLSPLGDRHTRCTCGETAIHAVTRLAAKSRPRSQTWRNRSAAVERSLNEVGRDEGCYLNVTQRPPAEGSPPSRKPLP